MKTLPNLNVSEKAKKKKKVRKKKEIRKGKKKKRNKMHPILSVCVCRDILFALFYYLSLFSFFLSLSLYFIFLTPSHTELATHKHTNTHR